jgi:hypothetical protein
MFAKKKKYNATQGNPEKIKGYREMGIYSKQKKIQMAAPPTPSPSQKVRGKTCTVDCSHM